VRTVLRINRTVPYYTYSTPYCVLSREMIRFVRRTLNTVRASVHKDNEWNVGLLAPGGTRVRMRRIMGPGLQTMFALLTVYVYISWCVPMSLSISSLWVCHCLDGPQSWSAFLLACDSFSLPPCPLAFSLCIRVIQGTCPYVDSCFDEYLDVFTL
jgi:hypothetical protein